MCENNCNWLKIAISILSAIGTLIVAIVAIWGDWVRAKLAPPKLTIDKHNLRGSLTNYNSGQKVIFYHLRVVNHRHWFVSRNCRVILKQIFKKGPDGEYHPVSYVVPLQFTWSPSEFTPIVTTINKEQVLDFGCIGEGDAFFKPTLYSYSNNFKGYLHAQESIRYCLEIISDNYVSKSPTIVEVSWNGQWNDNLDIMEQNLVIKVL
ncbi:MAG: hypothetical protein JW943_09435 [Deltaproteobacteria bacterium]|nr:hypothetical protein [Deltaproteobacteria bacterium]